MLAKSWTIYLQSVHTETKNLFYHYTNATALQSILAKRALWFSHWRFLNDVNEIEEGLKIVRQHVDTLMSSNSINGNHKSALRQYFEPDRYGAWVACFSEDGDSLTQWQAYGDNGRGYAIGFESDIEHALAADLYIKNIRYTNAGGRIDATHEEIQEIVHDMVVVGQSVEGAISMGRMKLAKLLACVKHESFQNEKEVRAFIPEFATPVGANQRIIFNPKNGVLVPVLEISTKPTFETNSDPSNPKITGSLRLPVKKIVIGPAHTQSTSRIGLEGFLSKFGYDAVEIVQSKVPYRPSII